jgi:hypothetical protein
MPSITVEEVWRYNGIMTVPGAPKKLEDRGNGVESLLELLASADVYALLRLVVRVGKTMVLPPPRQSIDSVIPVGTAFNLLDIVCRYSGFIQPTVCGATFVVDDLKLDGLDDQGFFKLATDNPGVFRVWYTADSSTTATHPCRVCRIQEYRTETHLVDIDHTSPRVLDRVFRRYAMLLVLVLHVQSHLVNTVGARLAHEQLARGDPLRQLMETCTSNTWLLEGVVAQKLFFNERPTAEMFAPLKWLSPKALAWAHNSSSSDILFPHVDNYFLRALHVSYNCFEAHKQIRSDSLICGLSPAMMALKQFQDVVHATCRRLAVLDPVQSSRRQSLLTAYNANPLPCMQSTPARDGFDILEKTMLMVVQHHFTHSVYMNDTSRTSTVLVAAVIPATSRTFGIHPDIEPVTRTNMSFGKNFAAALTGVPDMVCEVEQMLVQLQHIEQAAIRSGVKTFYDMDSSIGS